MYIRLHAYLCKCMYKVTCVSVKMSCLKKTAEFLGKSEHIENEGGEGQRINTFVENGGMGRRIRREEGEH